MSEAIQAWINEAAAHPAVAGCAIRVAGAVHVKSSRPELTDANITTAMKELADAVFFLQQNQFITDRLRWTFERGQIHFARGRGGMMAVLVTTRDAVNSPEIEQLLTKSLNAVTG
jgi:hypothetical protein